jgi:hypothetical protein
MEPASTPTRDPVLVAARDLLTGLTEALDLGTPAPDGEARGARVPPHLSFSDVPAIVREGAHLAEQCVAGRSGATARLVQWIARLDGLAAAIDILYAAGAIPGDVLHRCRRLIDQCDSLVARPGQRLWRPEPPRRNPATPCTSAKVPARSNPPTTEDAE